MRVNTENEVIAAILASDREKAIRIIAEWEAQHGYLSALNDILEPALVRIGSEYAADSQVSLAHGYIAAKVAEEILRRAIPTNSDPAGGRPAKGAVVVGNIEDDYHSLGRKMVSAFLRSSGWTVQDLGNDVPADSFVDAAIEAGARVVCVSAMMHTTALNILKVRREIDARGYQGRLQLAVGGAVFLSRPALVAQVGGDGTARNAMLAANLVETLWAQSLKTGDLS